MNGSVRNSPSRGVVLVVEDEIEVSRLIVELLTQAGYEVLPAYSVTDALGTLADQKVDAAVLDIELRDGPVFPVADRLARLGTPFLFASAVYFQMVPRQHQNVAFIGKPFNIDALLAHVEAALMQGRNHPPRNRSAD